MVEEDYIMRLIKELVRAVLKLLFSIDTDTPTAELLEDEESQNTLERLLDMIDEGNINEAENQLYDLTENKEMQNLKVALLFYSRLNEKSSDFLEEYGFSRGEVKMGLQDVVSGYGLNGMAETFLSDL